MVAELVVGLMVAGSLWVMLVLFVIGRVLKI